MDNSTQEETVWATTPGLDVQPEWEGAIYSAPTPPWGAPTPPHSGPSQPKPRPKVIRKLEYEPLNSTYSPVPLVPFPFENLPLIIRILVFESYLSSLGTRGQGTHCDCMKTKQNSWLTHPLTPSDLCYDLHTQFGYHARFLPLLLTSHAMHAEFRPLRYALGIFRIIPVNGVRDYLLRDSEPMRPSWPYQTRLSGDSSISHITPFPETTTNRMTTAVKAPLMPFQEVPLEVWNEIRILEIRMEFDYWRDWESVCSEFKGLVKMLGRREEPLKMLKVKMGWGRVDERGPSRMEGDRKSIWTKMVAPLGEIDWDDEDAPTRSALFRGQDRWDGDADVDAGEDENGEQRSFSCAAFAEFSRGLDGAIDDDTLETEYWHCGC